MVITRNYSRIKGGNIMVNLNDLSEALQRGDAKKVEELVKKALEENLSPKIF